MPALVEMVEGAVVEEVEIFQLFAVLVRRCCPPQLIHRVTFKKCSNVTAPLLMQLSIFKLCIHRQYDTT